MFEPISSNRAACWLAENIPGSLSVILFHFLQVWNFSTTNKSSKFRERAKKHKKLVFCSIFEQQTPGIFHTLALFQQNQVNLIAQPNIIPCWCLIRRHRISRHEDNKNYFWSKATIRHFWSATGPVVGFHNEMCADGGYGKFFYVIFFKSGVGKKIFFFRSPNFDNFLFLISLMKNL